MKCDIAKTPINTDNSTCQYRNLKSIFINEGNWYCNIIKIPKPKEGIKNVSMSKVFQNALNCFNFLEKINRLPQYRIIPSIRGKRRLYGL